MTPSPPRGWALKNLVFAASSPKKLIFDLSWLGKSIVTLKLMKISFHAAEILRWLREVFSRVLRGASSAFETGKLGWKASGTRGTENLYHGGVGERTWERGRRQAGSNTVTKLKHGGWNGFMNWTTDDEMAGNWWEIFTLLFKMYGGPRNPNSSPFQGRSRPLPQNFRPRFENPGFPPQLRPHAYWDFNARQPCPPSTHFQRPFGMTTHPQEPRGTFQPREWQMSGPRRGFPPTRNHDQQGTRV